MVREGGGSKRRLRKRVGGDSIAFSLIICDSIGTSARAAYVSLDLSNSYCYPRVTTEVADMLSRLGSISGRREPKPRMARGSLMPYIHVRYTECQSDYLQRGRKVLLPGGLWCTFGIKSPDRPHHWISSGGSHTVTGRCQHRITSERNHNTKYLTTNGDSIVSTKWEKSTYSNPTGKKSLPMR